MPARRYSDSPRPRSRADSSRALIDPYGIYGTRTANRMRAARRRRQTQSLLLVLLLIGVLALAVSWFKVRRVATIKPLAALKLWTPVTQKPVLAGSDAARTVLLPLAEGRLIKFAPGFEDTEKPQTILQTDFPLHTPLINGAVAYVPCEDGVLYALSWQQARVLWKARLGEALCARPALARITVAVRDASPSTPAQSADAAVAPRTTRREIVVVAGADGLIAALEAGSGKVVWRMRVPSAPGEALVSTSGAAPKILVPLLGSATMRGGLWCLDAASGKVLWRFPSDSRVQAAQYSPPIVDERANRVYFGSETGPVFALDLARGTYNAKQKIGWKSYAPPLSPKTENVISWRAAPVLFFGAQPATGGARLVAGGSNGGVRCFAAVDGRVLWSFDAESSVALLQKMRLGERDIVLVCTRSDTVFLLDAETGGALQRFIGRGKLTGALLAGNEVLAVSGEGVVERFPLEF